MQWRKRRGKTNPVPIELSQVSLSSLFFFFSNYTIQIPLPKTNSVSQQNATACMSLPNFTESNVTKCSTALSLESHP